MKLTIDNDLTNRIEKGIASAKRTIERIKSIPEHHQDKRLLKSQYDYIARMNKSLEQGFIDG